MTMQTQLTLVSTPTHIQAQALSNSSISCGCIGTITSVHNQEGKCGQPALIKGRGIMTPLCPTDLRGFNLVKSTMAGVKQLLGSTTSDASTTEDETKAAPPSPFSPVFAAITERPSTPLLLTSYEAEEDAPTPKFQDMLASSPTDNLELERLGEGIALQAPILIDMPSSSEASVTSEPFLPQAEDAKDSSSCCQRLSTSRKIALCMAVGSATIASALITYFFVSEELNK